MKKKKIQSIMLRIEVALQSWSLFILFFKLFQLRTIVELDQYTVLYSKLWRHNINNLYIGDRAAPNNNLLQL